MLPIRDSNPTRTTPFVTYALIGLNVVAWLYQLWLMTLVEPQIVLASYGLVPTRLLSDPAGESFTVLSSMFMHGDWGHLGWNMVFLWIFGDNVEDAVGHGRYLLFYLIAGAAAAAAQVLVDPASPVPMVGASGAIAGVLGAYVVLYPRAPVTILNPILPLWLLIGPLVVLPAWFVVGYWFLGNLLGGIGSLGFTQGGGVAFFAHLGGFVAGLVLIRPWMAGRHKAEIERWSGWRPPPRLPRAPYRGAWQDSRTRPGRWDPWS
jgi:membrane associated rhomboid family serine protease